MLNLARLPRMGPAYLMLASAALAAPAIAQESTDPIRLTLHDAAAGLNPDATHDCGKPFGPIGKVGRSGLKDKWPGACAAIKSLNLNTDELGAMT